MVIIVGGGPTGLLTALLLARYGVRSLVLERHREPYPLPRAVHLDDECVRILQKAGVAEEFAAISRPAPGLRFLDRQHRPLAEFRRERLVGAHGHPQANLFDQPDLEAVLGKAAEADPLIEIRRGVRVLGVDAAGRVLSEDGMLEADAVIGCDGAGSLVRRSIGARPVRLGGDQTWFVADLLGPPPERDWDGVEQICDPYRPATYLRVGERRLRWEFRMRPGETAAELNDRLGELLRPWTGGSAGSGSSGSAGDGVGERVVLRSTSYTFRASVADRWRRGRVLLAGDAAHLTPPFIGQGLGSGIRDADNLSWKLARVLHGEAGDGLLDSYQAERAPHVKMLIRLAVTAGALMSTRASAGLRLAARSQTVTRAILAGTSPALRPGPLVSALSPLSGTLCPQPLVSTGKEQPVLLDDLLGPGFALLTLGAPSGLDAQAAALGAKVIRVGRRGVFAVHCSDLRSDLLERWMDRAGVTAVLLRPDRVVLTTASGAAPV